MGRPVILRAACVVALMTGIVPMPARADGTVPAREASASGLALLQGIVSQVGAHSVVHADFVQTRTSALLSTPQVTRGSLVSVRERGIVWQVRSPQPQTHVYGRQRSARFDAEGVLLSLDAQPSAVTAQINEWANAFMRGDTSGLASQFEIVVTGSLNRWQIALTPSQPQVAQVMRRITLAGDTVVRTATLETRRGESVRWQFDKVRTADPLDANEQRLLRAVE